jgi:pimeloyl-ACP methyl ester carboxylesterase
MSTESEVVRAHRSAGRTFESARVQSFVREQGEGDPVVCLHGVPASSFLYRKVLAALAARGLRGVAFDLPGLGLAARPQDFDYSWTGLGRFTVAAVDALRFNRFHLVVHDIGGPVGFELAAAMPDRVASMTILNTVVAVDGFRRPWSMEPFAVRGLGELWLRSITKPTFRALMHLQGIGDGAAITQQELDAYLELLKRVDGGRAFLRIMRGFERTAEKQKLYEGAVRGVPYPVQVVWGAHDPALKLATHGEQARRIAEVEKVHALPAKHFLQEDQAPAVAELIAGQAATSPTG